MTNKEWKELCNWVNLLNNNKVSVDTYNIDEEVFSFIKVRTDDLGFEGIDIEKNGEITSCDGDIITRNSTPQQIKSIIENLL